jgi:DnaJ domain
MSNRSKTRRKRWTWPASLEFPDLKRMRVNSGYIPPCLIALGLPANATLDEVKRAFRSLSKQHHPDHGGDDKSFIRLRKSYEQALASCGNGREPILITTIDLLNCRVQNVSPCGCPQMPIHAGLGGMFKTWKCAACGQLFTLETRY